MDAGGRRSVLGGGGVIRVIPVSRPERLLEELRQVRGALDAGADLTPTAALQRGRWIRVAAGPLMGVIGVVADRRARRGSVRLILNVAMLGRGATVEIDPGDVELLPTPREARPAGRRRRGRPGPWDPSSPRAGVHSPAGLI
jgi:hypothetical protein